ncbi:MAG: phosphatase PAP2 family protein [Paludibacteraceae bacterium]|nr:phosphatase PAP2 family protein [Paludibacteraceae bacterium]
MTRNLLFGIVLTVTGVLPLTVNGQDRLPLNGQDRLPLDEQETGEYTLYYSLTELPNALVYVPAPPSLSSALFAYDTAQYQWGKRMRSTERGAQARTHATEDIGVMLKQFSEPFGLTLSEDKTPAIYRLAYRGAWNICFGTVFPKSYYMRERPYVYFGEPTLVPEDEERYKTDGSYPSAHTALGWGMALLLSELNQDAQDELLALGYEWGQSRVIAGFHWQSDVDAARMIAAACFARLHAHPDFIADMNEAKEEYARLKNGGDALPTVQAGKQPAGGIYTLQGQALDTPPKHGFYIEDGQKKFKKAKE